MRFLHVWWFLTPLCSVDYATQEEWLTCSDNQSPSLPLGQELFTQSKLHSLLCSGVILHNLRKYRSWEKEGTKGGLVESIVLLIHVQTSGREEALWSKRCVFLCVCLWRASSVRWSLGLWLVLCVPGQGSSWGSGRTTEKCYAARCWNPAGAVLNPHAHTRHRDKHTAL